MGFDVNEQGRVLSYSGTLQGTTTSLQRVTYQVRSLADGTGTAGYVTDAVSGNLGGEIGVEVTESTRTTRDTLYIQTRR